MTCMSFLNSVEHVYFFLVLVWHTFAFTQLCLCAAMKASKLKRKCNKVSAPSSHSKKNLKVAHEAAKQAASRQATAKNTKSSKTINLCPISDGCARASINGWEWRNWSISASPFERFRVRGRRHVHMDHLGSDVTTSRWSSGKGLSARTNRAKLRNLVAAAEGADLLKATQLKVIEYKDGVLLGCSFIVTHINYIVDLYATW